MISKRQLFRIYTVYCCRLLCIFFGISANEAEIIFADVIIHLHKCIEIKDYCNTIKNIKMTELLPLPKINTKNDLVDDFPTTPVELLSEDKLSHILTNVVGNTFRALIE